ncbi:family 1 glycosylhydrolase, partial [Cohnella sp. GbtcB17]|uniref:family 1 glycosylhydrolase n=1 Tax=Cohnella sp. GbtcB17 TaxID=2824762 RepID=UPI001C30B8B8
NNIGAHAPDNSNLQPAFSVPHNCMVAHGGAVKACRAVGISGEIGTTHNLYWFGPYTTKPEVVVAAHRTRAYNNEWFIGPAFKGEYPQCMVDWFKGNGVEVPILPGAMETIAEPIDFIGV